MICIQIRTSKLRSKSCGKWHYERQGQTLCGVRGEAFDRRDVALANDPEMICGNCDRELRRLGRATRLARKQRAAARRGALYRPVHRELFELSVTHLTRTTRTAPATTGSED